MASPTNLGGSEVQLTSTTRTTPATLQITGGGTYSNPITVGDGITTGVTGLVIYSGNVPVTFSGTLTKTGTTFELVGSNSLGGTVTITGQITGNTGSLNSDIFYNGGTFNLNGASPNTYFGPTYLTNAVTVNANSVGALPTLNGRSPVFMDQTGSGSSNLVLGANQSIAALTGATSSSVNLNGNTLTIGTDSGSTTFAGAISGAGGLIKDGASTQVLSGSNASYTGTTTVRAGALVLDYSTNNGTKLSSTAVLTLGSATLQLTGGTQTEVVGSTTITGGRTSSETTRVAPPTGRIGQHRFQHLRRATDGEYHTESRRYGELQRAIYRHHQYPQQSHDRSPRSVGNHRRDRFCDQPEQHGERLDRQVPAIRLCQG